MKKLLIANRGEILLRVVRSAAEKGIPTVAVYSDADFDTPGVRMADEAYALNGNNLAETYLNGDKILDIATKAGADAIHPGYGFLSEDADFVEKVTQAGITWVGPSANAIRLLGDKIQARRLAESNNVAPVPGLSIGADTPEGQAAIREFAATTGFPLVMKRADTGGGRGITSLQNSEDLDKYFADNAGNPALDKCFIEKLMQYCRHVETQCVRDTHGNFLVISTRDCSVQRRNQKIIEEAPAPFIPTDVEQTLVRWSHALFEAVNYVGAGTCEFLLTPGGDVHFLEVNPRLQVEHTVSETITGIDLVAMQLDIADGGSIAGSPGVLRVSEGDAPRLGHAQERHATQVENADELVTVSGHSLEARINAEDPDNDLTPATGRITDLQWPGGPGVRIDTFMQAGAEISGHYDSMIAKVIVHAPTRQAAIARLNRALNETRIVGVATNIPVLKKIINHPDFYGDDNSFAVYTRWFDDKNIVNQQCVSPQGSACANTAQPGGDNGSGASGGAPITPAGKPGQKTGRQSAPTPLTRPERCFVVEIDGKRVDLRLPAELLSGLGGGGNKSTATTRQPLRGRRNKPTSGIGEGDATKAVAPIPANVIRIAVEVGQHVAAGELLVVLEAMKMEKFIYAVADATVEAIEVSAGDTVGGGQVLVLLTPDDHEETE